MNLNIKALSWVILNSDGVVYLAHHAVTFFLAFCALHPFLHYYAAFYLGISEFSTGFLCLFLCFDDKNGLKARFPATATMLGILFAINFVIFRIVLWFFFSYHFWIDLIALYTSGRIHSYPAFFSYAIGNTGLTILQLIWLGEIVSNVLNMGKSADSGAGTKDELASSNVKKGHKSNRNKK